jgi:predicted nucleic acid-binding protein
VTRPVAEAGVCFDATPLITYNNIDRLGLLEDLFSGCALTPDVVKNDEVVKRLDKYPQNRRIHEAPWLEAVKVEEPEDTRLVAQLLAIWDSDPRRDEGEAEVIALCRRFGWTAVMDDGRGRDAAKRYGVNCVYTVTAIIAASALSRPGALGRKDAWLVHQEADADRGPNARAMPIEDEYRPAFMKSLKGVRKRWQARGEPEWPQMLADPALDEIVEINAARIS